MIMFAKLWNDESGASAAEYALILAIVGAAIAVSMTNLGNAVKTKIDTATTQLGGTIAP
jgi:pilus assembly protein Flp/PilA